MSPYSLIKTVIMKRRKKRRKFVLLLLNILMMISVKLCSSLPQEQLEELGIDMMPSESANSRTGNDRQLRLPLHHRHNFKNRQRPLFLQRLPPHLFRNLDSKDKRRPPQRRIIPSSDHPQTLRSIFQKRMLHRYAQDALDNKEDLDSLDRRFFEGIKRRYNSRVEDSDELKSSSNNFNFRQWESQRVEGSQEFRPTPPPAAFWPPDLKSGSIFPILRNDKAEDEEEMFIRPFPADRNIVGGNNRVNLQTEYFSLPSVRSSSEDHGNESTKGRKKIPVLVKKLAKRPVKKKTSSDSDSDDDDDNTDGVVFVNPRLIKKNATDLCPNSDKECNINGNQIKSSSDNSTSESVLMKFIRTEIWVVPILVSAGSLLAVLVIFELYLISKAIALNPSRRHLFLGQMLMLGLLMCCAVAVVITMKPSSTSCSVIRVGLGLGYTIIFSTLLVKLVFLISLNSGVYLPATYQGLLLCFAILIQLVISVQWLMSTPADVLHLTMESGEIYSTCNVPFQQQILGLLYVIFLVLVVVILAFKSRGVRENYREAMYIGLTIGFAVCFFTIWITAGFLSASNQSDVCIACGLVACSAITFIIMFMPKGRQLAAMGREGIYSEDRDDVYGRAHRGGGDASSTRSTDSGGTPSPSFFPIRPPGKLVNQFRDRERLDTPPLNRKTELPPSNFKERHLRAGASHQVPVGHHHHHHDNGFHEHSHQHHHQQRNFGHRQQRHNHLDQSMDSMVNLIGTNHDDPDGHVFRGNNGAFNARWRSRSSPPVANRFRQNGGDWFSEGTTTNPLFGFPRDRSPSSRPFNSSFHDLHAANEIRSNRNDLQELRDLLRQSQTDLNRQRSWRSSRRSLHERKWPPPQHSAHQPSDTQSTGMGAMVSMDSLHANAITAARKGSKRLSNTNPNVTFRRPRDMLPGVLY